jgi:hypothetical protein
LPALLAVFSLGFGLNTEAQVLTNRTPDKTKIQEPDPKPSPRPTPDGSILEPDPALFLPGAPRPAARRKFEPTPLYYVRLERVNRLLVSDPQGRTDDLFPKGGGALKVLPLSYDQGVDSVYVMVPVGDTYSITFGTDEPSLSVEIVRGRGNVSPDEAIRYNDVVVGNGTGRLEFTAAGVGPVRLDANNDGRFESIVQPTAHVTGLAAKDTHRPRVEFEVLKSDATTIIIAIKAVDVETGVKKLFYSFDGLTDVPYEGPVRIRLKDVEVFWAIAEDHAGNQTIAAYDITKRQRYQ